MRGRVAAVSTVLLALMGAGPARAAGTTAEAKTPAAARPVLSQPQPSFRGWQELLDVYVHVDAPRDSGFRTSFNYEKFYDDPDRMVKSFAVRQQFLRISPRDMDPVTRPSEDDRFGQLVEDLLASPVAIAYTHVAPSSFAGMARLSLSQRFADWSPVVQPRELPEDVLGLHPGPRSPRS